MSLEIKLKALELSMNGRLDEITEDIIAVDGVQELLITHFAERDTKPELVNQIRSWSIMYDYLNLELKERDELEDFARENPEYMSGENRAYRTASIIPEKLLEIVKRQRYVNQLLKLFDFYLEHREDFQMFDTGYLQRDENLKNRFGNLGNRLYDNARNNLKEGGGIDYFVQLVSEQRPEIKRYTSFREVLKIDGVRKLCEMFDSYLEHRGDLQAFDTSYLIRNRNLKDRFGNTGQRLYDNALRNFKYEGGIDYLIRLVSKQRPEITQYTSFKEVLKIDGPKKLCEMFDFYLENRKDFQVFDTGYLKKDRSLKDRFGNTGQRLYDNALRNFKDEGGIDYLIRLASQQRSETTQYTSFREVLKIDGVRKLCEMFDFYLKHREDFQMFDTGYLLRNKDLKNKFGNLGHNLYQNARNNFKQEGGIDYLIKLASQQRPEILEHWKGGSLLQCL